MSGRNDHMESLRHSCEHVLTMAMLRIWGNKIKAAMGPATDDGFYFDFDSDIKVSEEDLPKIEKEMAKIIKEDLPITKDEMTVKEARDYFGKNIYKGNQYKHEWIDEIEKRGEKVSVYWMGEKGKDIPETFGDICAGPHLASTEKIGVFKLTRLAGAYWHGDEKNKMLQRIYGICFDTQKEMDEYLHMLEEAKKRDHRKLGKELDLFHIDEKVGAGLVLWHPKGAILWRIIEDFWYKEHLKNGYQLVRSPHIGNRVLWETSGHWGFYNESMYPPMEAGQSLSDQQAGKKAEFSEQYLLKPMNCPFHVQIYNDKPHSYRELPFRWAETGTVYRFERTGQLSGLTRVRGFTQDDAHIILRKDQVEEELKKVIDFILFIYRSFGFDDEHVKVYLSLRDPENKTKYAGGDDGWEFTETVLRKVAQEKHLNFTEEKGEAAFYGPKLDFKINDVIGREWQCSTLQFDFNLPEKFKMEFTDQEGKEERPYMLHRALFGSFERFIGLLIEHYAGAFPVWLSPIQARILPVSEKFNDYAHEVAAKLKEKNFRVEVDDSNETLGKKIRNAELMKVPYMVVVGEKELEAKSVAVRDYSTKKQEIMNTHKFIEKLEKEVEITGL